MAGLSNYLWPHQPPRDAATPLVCRQAAKNELEAALRLILASASGPASAQQILDFANFAQNRGVDMSDLWVAIRQDQIEWALLPIVSPGRTMLLISPTRFTKHTPHASAIALARQLLDHHAAEIDLAQMLLDPEQTELRDVYRTAGFEPLAELIYLNRPVKKAMPPPKFRDGFTLQSYSAETHAYFERAIQRSYAGSLDCPGLNGLRKMIDVIEGHKAAGEFDPALWSVLLDDRNEPSAVLLLTRAANDEAVELIYLGLSPHVRGRGVGDAMMNLALSMTTNVSRRELALAVDAKNTPAMNLYFRHGMKRVGSRLAMLAEMRK